MTFFRLRGAVRSAVLLASVPLLASCGEQFADCNSTGMPEGGITCQPGECSFTTQIVGRESACGFTNAPTGERPGLCEHLCGKGWACTHVAGASAVTCMAFQNDGAATGRRPAGLAQPEFERSLGGFLARAAYLEAASVVAFRILESELAELGAPVHLRRAARRARKDEARHARLMRRLAARDGSTHPPVRVRTSRARSLREIAIENAVEGCVAETFGAAIAMWQAKHAADEEVRRTMREIARDELRHAHLAWRTAEWLERRLDLAARREVADARSRAAREFRFESIAAFGLPSAEQCHRMRAAILEIVPQLTDRCASSAPAAAAASA